MSATLVMYAGTAAIGLGLIGLVLVVGMPRKEPAGGSEMEDRIKAYGAGAGQHSAAAAPTSLKESATATAQQVLDGSHNLEVRIAARLEGAGYAIKPAEWVLLHAGIAVASGFVLFAIGRANPVPALLGLVAGAVVPWLFLGIKRSRRVKAFEGALPETLQLMSGSLSAGLSLTQTVDTIVREGSEPIVSEFKRAVVESRLGVALDDALEGIAERMGSKDFGWVVMAIRIQREVGGNLAELLLTVAGTLREREYMRRQVRALSAEGRLSCYVLGGLPPGFLAYLSLTRWTYVSPLFTTSVGFVLCGAMLVLLGGGMFWMMKVAKVNI